MYVYIDIYFSLQHNILFIYLFSFYYFFFTSYHVPRCILPLSNTFLCAFLSSGILVSSSAYLYTMSVYKLYQVHMYFAIIFINYIMLLISWINFRRKYHRQLSNTSTFKMFILKMLKVPSCMIKVATLSIFPFFPFRLAAHFLIV